MVFTVSKAQRLRTWAGDSNRPGFKPCLYFVTSGEYLTSLCLSSFICKMDPHGMVERMKRYYSHKALSMDPGTQQMAQKRPTIKRVFFF